MQTAPTQTIAYVIRNSLYLSITDRCTLQCAFCPKIQGVKKVHDFDLTLDHRPEVEEIIQSIDDPKAYDEVVFCGYGEPTLRLKVLLDVAHYIKGKGGRVRVNTDGLANHFHKRNVLPELAQCVDALSVSMNAQNETVYDQHCLPQLRGSFDAMIGFLRMAPEYISSVTATAINGLDGVDMEACERLAMELCVNFRYRELDVVG
ncbi:MAG: radical SAM protein [Gammaproteobacteria bacterium]|nr:radical SAM protein [Gammaproteobacteria bacterium]